MKAAVAGAPVSFGVFELTPDDAETMAPDDMLRLLAEAGYAGIDLGPLGFLGRGGQLRSRLREFGLGLAGGWVQLPFTDDDAFEAALPALDDALRVFADASEEASGRLPLPTLADSGSALRAAAPGRGAEVDPVGAACWSRLRANAERAAARVRAAGFEPTFHHHAGTFVESAEEIDSFLADIDIDMTLDTGHLVLAGGDPVEALRRWGARINHLHLKDVDRGILDRVLAAGGGMREVWSSGAFVAFGSGDIPLDAVMRAVDALDFDGWIVVEQDVLNAPDASITDFARQRAADQQTNRAALREWA